MHCVIRVTKYSESCVEMKVFGTPFFQWHNSSELLNLAIYFVVTHVFLKDMQFWQKK